MKKLLCLLLGVVMLNHAMAQNSLDRAGLGASTPAAAAYSLRLLSTAYTGAAVQVRRSSDDGVLDIPFTASGDADTAALLAFAAGGDVFVSSWYDQSGNGRDMVKGNTNEQPQIVFAGALKHIGGRVAIDFNVNKGLVFDGNLTVASISTVLRSESLVWPGHHAILDGSPRIGALLNAGGNNMYGDAVPLQVWKNGVPKAWNESLSPVNEGMVLSVSTHQYALTRLYAGNYDGATQGGSILESEAIAFTSLIPATDRESLECNQAWYYRISTPCNTVIHTQPSAAGFGACLGSPAPSLSVAASGAGLTYQWYRHNTAANTGGSLIPGATSSSMSPATDALGTSYYYVEVVNNAGVMATSDVSGAIIVDAPPVVFITASATVIDSGSSVTLLASGASSYIWGAPNATPLDQVNGFRMAVGLRRLRSAYSGPAIRLRRGSDNAEADFGFVGSELDLGAINSFLAGSDGFCMLLYDQAGFGNNMTQANVSEQPLFVAAGLNGQPVLRFTTSNAMQNATNFTPPFTVIYTARQTGPSRQRVLTCNNNWLLGWWNGDKGKAHFDGWVTPSGGSSADNNAYVYSGTGTGSISSVYENGVLLASNSGGVAGPNGPSFNGNERSDFDVSELFIFDAVLAEAERELVENSSGSYYGVFGAPPVSGASLLVTPTISTTYTVTGYSANGGCAVEQTAIVTVLKNPGLSGFSAQEKLFYDSAYTIAAPVSSSAGAFSYRSSNPAVAVINGDEVLITGTGVTNITAVQAADGGYFEDSISSTLTVTTVAVVSSHGAISSTNYRYVNKYGMLGKKTGVDANGANRITKSGGNGRGPATAGSSAYQIKTEYPASLDGLYWISNPNINGGAPFQIYADMTTDGGGWTLILCNMAPNPGWTNEQALLRNENSPSINSNYSIIGWADHIKKSNSGFQYMIDAQNRTSNGGIWTANGNYSFVSQVNSNTNITLNTKFGNWEYAGGGIEARMPWYAPGSEGLITTSESPGSDWWGTLVASTGWSPAPWLGSHGMEDPGVIWYWVR